MAFTFGGLIGSAINNTSSTSALTITVGAAGVPVGALVVVNATKNTSVASITAADTQGNAYTTRVTNAEPVDSQTVSFITAVLTTALVSGNTITVTYGTGFSEKLARAEYWTADGTIGWGSAASADSTFPHTAKSAGSLTVSDNELVVCGYLMNTAPGTWTQGSGYTAGGTVNGSSSISSLFTQYDLDTNTSGAFATPATTSSGSSTAGVSSRFTEASAAVVIPDLTMPRRLTS